MDPLLFLITLSIPLALNVWASRLILADEFLTLRQSSMQLALVWLLPLVGALLVLAAHRKAEPPSRSYRSGLDAGDDYASSTKSVKSIREALDGD